MSSNTTTGTTPKTASGSPITTFNSFVPMSSSTSNSSSQLQPSNTSTEIPPRIVSASAAFPSNSFNSTPSATSASVTVSSNGLNSTASATSASATFPTKSLNSAASVTSASMAFPSNSLNSTAKPTGNTSFPHWTPSNSSTFLGNLTIDGSFPYIIPFNDTQSCDIYGPLCQPGSITVNSIRGGQTSLVTMPCSSYLSAQSTLIRDSHVTQQEEWRREYGRSPQCHSYASMIGKGTPWTFSECRGSEATGTADPASSDAVPTQVPAGLRFPKNENCCGQCDFILPELRLYYFADPNAEAWCSSQGRTMLRPNNMAEGNSTKGLRRRGLGGGIPPTITQQNGVSTAVVSGYTLTSPSLYLEIVGTLRVYDDCGDIGEPLVNPIVGVPAGGLMTEEPRSFQLGEVAIGHFAGQQLSEAVTKSWAPGMGAEWLTDPFNFKTLNVAELECPTVGVGMTETTYVVNGETTTDTYTTIGSPFLPYIVPPKAISTLRPDWNSLCAGRVAENILGVFDPPRALALVAPNKIGPDGSPTPAVALPDETATAQTGATPVDGQPTPTDGAKQPADKLDPDDPPKSSNPNGGESGNGPNNGGGEQNPQQGSGSAGSGNNNNTPGNSGSQGGGSQGGDSQGGGSQGGGSQGGGFQGGGSQTGGSQNGGSQNGGSQNGGSQSGGSQGSGSQSGGSQDGGSQNGGSQNGGSQGGGSQGSGSQSGGSQDGGSQNGGSQDDGHQGGGHQEGGSQGGGQQQHPNKPSKGNGNPKSPNGGSNSHVNGENQDHQQPGNGGAQPHPPNGGSSSQGNGEHQDHYQPGNGNGNGISGPANPGSNHGPGNSQGNGNHQGQSGAGGSSPPQNSDTSNDPAGGNTSGNDQHQNQDRPAGGSGELGNTPPNNNAGPSDQHQDHDDSGDGGAPQGTAGANVPESNPVIVIGGDSRNVGAPINHAPLQPITVGHQTFDPAPSGFTVGGMTVKPGGPPVTVAHTPISLGPSGILHVGSKTISLQPFGKALPTHNAMTVAGQVFTPNPTGFVVAGKSISPNGPAAFISSTQVSLGPSGRLIVGTETISLPTHQPQRPTPMVLTIAHQAITPNPSGFVIAGKTIMPGVAPVTISGTRVSLGTAGQLEIGTQTFSLPDGASSGPILIAGHQTITPKPAGFAIAEKTLSPGGTPITVSGTRISLGSLGQLEIGTRTFSLASENTRESMLTIGDQTITPNPTGFLIADKTLPPGGAAITVSGTRISLGTAGQLEVGTETFSLSKDRTLQPVVAIGDQTITPAPTGFVIDGKTLFPGGTPITVSGTRVSLGQSGQLAIGSTTISLPTDEPLEAAVTIGDQTITPSATGFVIDGKTLFPGGAPITVSGTRVSLGQSGQLAIGTSTLSLPTEKLLEPTVTIGHETITPNPTGFVIDGTTIIPGGAPVTISGTRISLGSSGQLVIGTSTLSLPTDELSEPAVTIGHEIISPDPEGFVIDGITITSGGSAVTVSGTRISLGPSGQLVIGSSTIFLHAEILTATEANPTGTQIGPSVQGLASATTPIATGAQIVDPFNTAETAVGPLATGDKKGGSSAKTFVTRGTTAWVTSFWILSLYVWI